MTFMMHKVILQVSWTTDSWAFVFPVYNFTTVFWGIEQVLMALRLPLQQYYHGYIIISQVHTSPCFLNLFLLLHLTNVNYFLFKLHCNCHWASIFHDVVQSLVHSFKYFHWCLMPHYHLIPCVLFLGFTLSLNSIYCFGLFCWCFL